MITKEQLIKILALNTAKALAAVILAVGVTGFFNDRIEKIGDSLVEKRAAVYALTHRSEILSKLKSDLDAVGDGAKLMNAAIPRIDDLSGFMDAIDNFGNQTGLQQSVTYGSYTASSPELYMMSFGINLGAKLGELTWYLKTFEALPYLAQIDSISIGSSGARGILDKSSVSIQAKFYAKNPF